MDEKTKPLHKTTSVEELQQQMLEIARNANQGLAEAARLRAELDAAKAENERLKKEAVDGVPRRTILKVSEKGAVTFNAEGMRRFGLTLYEQEWNVLFDNIPAIKAYVQQNTARLSKLEK